MTIATRRKLLRRAAATAILLATLATATSISADDDTRGNFTVYPYVGLGIDSFAAGSIKDYLNQGESGDIEERLTAGFEFSYRLSGNKTNSDGRQLWIYGRTTHGVRSADVDCRANMDNPLCTPFSQQLQDPSERGLYVLRNSSSLEGIIGLRWEFRPLQRGTGDSPARMYVGGQLGFVSVADGPDDVADVHHIAIGATISDGNYENSFLEIGYGVNDLFIDNDSSRFKINARVTKRFSEKRDWGAFAHIAVDVDASDGSDSVQTYIGLFYRVGRD